MSIHELNPTPISVYANTDTPLDDNDILLVHASPDCEIAQGRNSLVFHKNELAPATIGEIAEIRDRIAGANTMNELIELMTEMHKRGLFIVGSNHKTVYHPGRLAAHLDILSDMKEVAVLKSNEYDYSNNLFFTVFTRTLGLRSKIRELTIKLFSESEGEEDVNA